MDKPRTMKWKGLILTEYATGAYIAENTGMPVAVAEVWFDGKTYCASVRLTLDPTSGGHVDSYDIDPWQALGTTPKRALTNAARKGVAFYKEAVRRTISFLGARA